MARTGRSLLLAVLLPIAPLLSAAACADPVVAAPAAPAAPQDPKGVVALPFRALARTRVFAGTAALRFVCTRFYSAVVDGHEVPCTEVVTPAKAGAANDPDDPPPTGDGAATVSTAEPGDRWRFRKVVAGATQTLELVVAPSPVRGYDLHLIGELREADGKIKPNPELIAIESDIESFLTELAAGPLDPAKDRVLPYQLSYVQADRAIAVLRTLGYTVVEYKKTSSSEKVVFDTLFEQLPAARGGLLVRPLIIKLIDSEDTSLVENAFQNADPELAGGQPLSSVPDAAPQQRLLIVHDTDDRPSLDLLLAHLERDIDVPARQILIEALVIELNYEGLLELGIDFKGRKDNFDISFEQQTGGLVQPFLFNFARPSPRTLLELTAKLRALEENGQATVLSRPSVFVLDGRQARIKVGDNVPYTSKVTLGVGGVITSETTFLKTGIILNLRPRAAADNSDVTLQVEAIISSPGPTRVLPDLGALLAPNLQSRQIQTLVRVANDTPFVIGGLIAENDQHSTSGLPHLSRLRYLGALFRKKNARNDRREVIVVITPHVVAVDDPTYAYTIPRDAGRADTESGARGAAGRYRPFADRAPSCKPDSQDELFDPEVSQPDVETGSIFDSLDPQLFRSIYRLRSSDIFDLDFITKNEEVKRLAARSQELAKSVSEARFEKVPRVDRPSLEKEVVRRLEEMKAVGDDDDKAKFVDTFLTFFDGGVPGEEILVHNMMIRVIEKLGFGSCVPTDEIIYFPDLRDREAGHAGRELDPDFLSASDCVRSCLETGTLVLAFPPTPAESDDFLTECLEERPRPVCARQGAGQPPAADNPFSPPIARVACVSHQKDRFLDHLRNCNAEKRGWRTILLDRDFKRRGRNSIGLLQSVLTLERLLELNDSHTFLRTLRGFHVGRELVLPTREDMQTRRHLIDRETARLFYQTLDYYQAFADAYKEKTTTFASKLEQVQRNVTEAATHKAAPP